MTTGAAPELRAVRGGGVSRERLGWMASIAFCGVLPALVLVLVFASSIGDGSYAIDFGPFYRAAEDVLAGRNPYPGHDGLLTASGKPWVYPPLPALLAAPLTVLPLDVASVLVMVSLVLVALAIPYVLGVRDWRCYGLVLLWPPVISAIQSGNVTLWLALASALSWRYRDRPVRASVIVGVTLAIKFVLWPLLVWIGLTRRLVAALVGVGVGATLVLASWTVIGLDGLGDYPDLLRRLERVVGDDAYTIFNLAHDLGAPSSLARAVWLGLGVALLIGCGVFARRRDERSAFILALAASLALTPLVWLHYFSLLIVAVAVARPRLGVMWFVPLAMFLAPGTGDPTPLETALVLGVAAATVTLAVRDSRRSEVVA